MLELLLAHDLIAALVRRRYPSCATSERLFDEAWTQFVLGPRDAATPWRTTAQRAYWRGEVAALRSPEDLAREDAREVNASCRFFGLSLP